MIRLINICKNYVVGDTVVKALDKVSIDIKDNSFTAITGHSGSGKTTLLNIMAGYTKCDEGLYLYDNKLVNDFDSKMMTDFFRNEVGMIFQEFHLLPYLNVYENIRLPLIYQKKNVDKSFLDKQLNMVGLKGYGNFRPDQLSGGQKQRVAIARTLVSGVKVVLADEPTGALDRKNASNIVKLLADLRNYGVTVVIVTHDEKIASQAERMIVLENGHVVSK